MDITSPSPLSCSTQSFALPSLYGAEIQKLTATPVTNFSMPSRPFLDNTKSVFSNLSFCNVTVEYTHLGRPEHIKVVVLLPEHENWNVRFQGTGGGGWAAGIGVPYQIPAVDLGYAAASTDAGIPMNPFTSDAWALLGPGTADIARLNLFASVALHDMTVIDPRDYDGILAHAPALNWGELFGTLHWPKQVMANIGEYPAACEIAGVVAGYLEACDGLDGIVDGVISDPDACDFDPHSLVGRQIPCDGGTREISKAAAEVMKQTYGGPRKPDGSTLWYGYDPGSSVKDVTNIARRASSNCTSSPAALAESWSRLWVAENPDLDVRNMSHAQYAELFHQGVQRYDSIIGTRDADISAFRDNGGKMLTWHGMYDSLIPAKGTVDYYDRVRRLDERVDDYFRLFLAPGTEHCAPAAGPYPKGALEALTEWVEKGKAPEYLRAINVTNLEPLTGLLKGNAEDAARQGRPLCRYPKVQEYVGGDVSLMASFRCVEPADNASYVMEYPLY